MINLSQAIEAEEVAVVASVVAADMVDVKTSTVFLMDHKIFHFF